MNKRLHLSGFMLFAPAPHMINSWVYDKGRMPWKWHEPAYWEHIARTLERGKFDLFFFADGWAGGAMPPAVRYAIQFPNHDPVSLVSYLSAIVKRLGFAVTTGNLNTLSISGSGDLFHRVFGLEADAAAHGVAAHATKMPPDLEGFVADVFVTPAPQLFP